ncbi:uroporphyrinogen-III synthase [Luteirhabdus pelagi]|uniref:uroporphyrinogen-III synthase n=1 Tax=Luteirhabdus pelagi TaxID=2792783 RepID=UPI00193930C9|nr:uroporphyrinogen-III synthase [Luteirhabdus pelagi]
MKSVLSTKKLTIAQKELLLNSGLTLVEYDAIGIELTDFEMPSNVTNAIFSSQNAVRAFLRHPKRLISELTLFCVGPKTAATLEDNGYSVSKIAENSSNLADFIIKNHKNDAFHYFCGNKRRDELPSALKNENIRFKEIETYKTVIQNRRFTRTFDAILFYSPSGVESYVSANLDPPGVENPAGLPTAICIGPTTASAAENYFGNVITANSTSVESVIAKAAKFFNSQ